jgi:hypothetical protein
MELLTTKFAALTIEPDSNKQSKRIPDTQTLLNSNNNSLMRNNANTLTRMDKLWLFAHKTQIQKYATQLTMNPTKHLSHLDKQNIVKLLTIMQKTSFVHKSADTLSTLISTLEPLQHTLWSKVQLKITRLCGIVVSDILQNWNTYFDKEITPSSAQELFAAMTVNNSLSPYFSQLLFNELNITTSSIRPYVNCPCIALMGQSSSDVFWRELKSHVHWPRLETVITYIGCVTIEGNLE